MSSAVYENCITCGKSLMPPMIEAPVGITYHCTVRDNDGKKHLHCWTGEGPVLSWSEVRRCVMFKDG